MREHWVFEKLINLNNILHQKPLFNFSLAYQYQFFYIPNFINVSQKKINLDLITEFT